MSPEYAAALDTIRAAGATYREAVRAFRAEEITMDEYLAAREASTAAGRVFDAAFIAEQARDDAAETTTAEGR